MDMIWQLQDPDAKPGNGPFLFCSWQCHLCLRDWASSKVTWLCSSSAVAATVKCLRKLTWHFGGLLGYSTLLNGTCLGLTFSIKCFFSPQFMLRNKFSANHMQSLFCILMSTLKTSALWIKAPPIPNLGLTVLHASWWFVESSCWVICAHFYFTLTLHLYITRDWCPGPHCVTSRLTILRLTF